MYRLPYVLGMSCLLLITRSGNADEQYGAKRTNIEIGKHQGFILHPAKQAPAGPWVWYAPTIGAHPNKANEWVLRKLLDEGFHVCGVNVGESYGSPAGRKVFSEFHQHVVREYKLEAGARLLAQSRGGLMHYNWAAENPDKVRCIVGIYPVCDLRSYPGLKQAAGAYGMTPAELEKQLTKHNPIDRLEPLAKAGVPILHIHGDADTVVPLDKNSQVVFDRYLALGGKMKLIVVPGKGHAEIPQYFQEPRLVQVLKDGDFAGETSKVDLTVKADDERISVFRSGQKQPILEQVAKSDFRPYLHPIVAPDGKGVLTEFSPGHHKHQTGLYVGHTRVNGKDYFHNPGKDYFQRKSLKGAAEGNKATWSVVYDLLGKDGPVLRETQSWTLTDLGTSYILDLDWKGEALVDVTVGKYQYGGVFVRMPHKGQGTAINSDGLKDGQAEQKRAKWVDIGLPIEGRAKDDWGHIAILDHKSNPDHPSPWRVDGQLGISPTRAILGDWSIPRGKTAEARYRFVVYTGTFDAKRIEAAFDSWK